MDDGCGSGGGDMGGGGGGCDFGGGGGGGFSSGGGDFGGGGGFSSGGGDLGGEGGGFSSGGGDFGGGGGFSSCGGTDNDFGGGGFNTSSHDNFDYNHGHNTFVHPTAGVGFIPGPHGGYTGTHYTTANNFGQSGSNVTVFGAPPTTIYQPTRSSSCAKFSIIMFVVFCVTVVLLSILVPVIVFTTLR